MTSQAFSLMQVFCQSSEENNSFPQVLTSESGLIAFTSLNFKKDNQVFLFLSLKKLSTTTEMAIQWAQRMLYHIRNLIILHVGIKDFEDDLDKNSYDRLKRQLKVLDSMVSCIFGNSDPYEQDRVPMMMKPELLYSSLSVSSHLKRNEKIVGMLKSIQKQFKIEHMALWIDDKIYSCTQGWNNIHEADLSMLFLYKKVYSDSVIFDIPLYLTHTSLLDDMSQIGKIPYRYVIFQLSELFKLTIISDPLLDINDLNDFVRSYIDKDMSQQLILTHKAESPIELETPQGCVYWQYIQHREHNLRSFAYKNQYEKYQPIVTTLTLQMPIVKNQLEYQKQLSQHQISVDQVNSEGILYQQFIFVEENNMQFFRLKDKNDNELQMLFEKEQIGNLVVKNFYKRLINEFGDNDQQTYDYIIQ
ncbi:UNKNOWN [Stylonychia lemnae]|uniref:Uncharacterized protein n=1 Tax=Stylonychia lemnae TaxID=5949 RepID=A0A078AIS1_STYLE|nr:UNKNOWN [Stylonychia lemnae]|eukprot:CDW82119.1 UNKNOWN [Stylonychia lemnae]